MYQLFYCLFFATLMQNAICTEIGIDQGKRPEWVPRATEVESAKQNKLSPSAEMKSRIWATPAEQTIEWQSLHGNLSREILSVSPRIYYISNLLSDKECDYIIHKSTPELKRSTVLASKGEEIDPRRSSKGMFFSSQSSDPLLRAIEDRISALTQTPVENGEGFQVLHYQQGGEYQPHYDYFSNTTQGQSEALKRGGQRVLSVIMYLNAPDEGGETVFPIAKVSVKPKKGDAVMFYNVTPEGVNDVKSLHGGAPVLKGEKWIVTKWIREEAFN